jgi:Asp/Glu/hydantoin racemase
MNQPDLIFLHTSPVNIAPFAALASRFAPELVVEHRVDEALIAAARARGGDDPEVVGAVRAAMEQALATGARAVVCTCSSIGHAAESTPGPEGTLVMRIDRPMADRAVMLGPKVLVVAALESTLPPTTNLLRDSAQRLGRSIVLETLFVEGAWAHFERGDNPAFWRAIAQAVRQALPGPDVVVLAQASMAGARTELEDIGIEVLTSPELGVQAAVARLQSEGLPR